MSWRKTVECIQLYKQRNQRYSESKFFFVELTQFMKFYITKIYIQHRFFVFSYIPDKQISDFFCDKDSSSKLGFMKTKSMLMVHKKRCFPSSMTTKGANEIHKENSALTWQFQWRIYENQVEVDTTQTSSWAILPILHTT